jgi:hypothetical protein
MKHVVIICRFFVLALLIAYGSQAHAQFTVFDPTTYGEEVENFGQLYNENQTTLQQFQMAVQQYNLLNSQYQRLASMARYATSANPWAAMPITFNSQGRIGGWATTINTGGYANANAALSQSQYQYTMPSSSLNGTPDQNTRMSMQASSVDLHNNSLQDSLSIVGGIRNNALANDAALQNLAADAADEDDAFVTQTAIAQKQSIALSIIASAQSDTNKALTALIELQMASAQQTANDRSMALTDAANQNAGWQNGSQASGTGTGTLNSSFVSLQNAAVSVAQ